MLKTLFQLLKYFTLLFISSLIIYFLAAYILSSISTKEENQPKEMAIYLSTNGMHTDFIFPVRTEEMDWSEEIKFSDTKSKDSIQKYISIGWGNKSFFLDVPSWEQIESSIAIKAALGIGDTAMHTEYLKQVYEDESCKKVLISKEQYKKLITYILKYFKRNEKGEIVNIKTNNVYSNSDSFYEATYKYHIFFTCNTWTNNALKEAGLKACVWTPFQQGIFKQYNKK